MSSCPVTLHASIYLGDYDEFFTDQFMLLLVRRSGEIS